ncbi:MAG TPA: LysE family transporter [Stellaceae bacterium]|nr:LysE family transporter [Stellaceae bacterium]
MLVGFLLKGLVVGIVIAIPVGPVGVLCIRRTVFSGQLAGFLSGLGAATGDAAFGIIAGFGLTVVADWLLDYQHLLRFLGAAFLLVVGAKALMTEPAPVPRRQADPETLARFFASTFALTLTNPVTLLSFLAIFAAVGLTGKEATLAAAAVLVLGIWLGSLLWWLALCLGASLWRRTLSERHLRWINRGSGGILFLSGVALIGSLVVRLV